MTGIGNRHPTTAEVCEDAGSTGRDRWFVGFRFRTPLGSVGRQFFVVGEAADAEDAVAIAMARASLPAPAARATTTPRSTASRCGACGGTRWGGSTSPAPAPDGAAGTGRRRLRHDRRRRRRVS